MLLLGLAVRENGQTDHPNCYILETTTLIPKNTNILPPYNMHA